MNIPVVYEDEWLVAVDKPSGLIVIPAPNKAGRTLVGILNDDLSKQGKTYRLHPCHRIDRETSGLIIFAKGKSIQKKMMDEFRRRRVQKTYVALVRGHLQQKAGQIKRPIEGKPASTGYRVIERKKNFDIIEVYPASGRTNQIRIHFSGIEHPLLGESKFAFRRDFSVKAKRLCLHARELEFTHPVTGKKTHLQAQMPPDMQKIAEMR